MERNPKIDPVLKGWLDNVLVPALLLKFHAENVRVGDNDQVRIARTVSGISIPEQVQ
jgi:hypothetical protein